MVYLIHLTTNLGHARHYIGYCKAVDPSKRLAQHKSGNGSAMLNECNRRGIQYDVVRTFPHYGRNEERRLKNWHNAYLLCPICNPNTYATRGNHADK